MYIEVFEVHPDLKTRFVALKFLGQAAVWLQTVQHQGQFQTWDSTADVVFNRFDKDQHQIQLRQLDSLKQLSSVEEYQYKCDELSHDILLYNSSYDYTFFVTCFFWGVCVGRKWCKLLVSWL